MNNRISPLAKLARLFVCKLTMHSCSRFLTSFQGRPDTGCSSPVSLRSPRQTARFVTYLGESGPDDFLRHSFDDHRQQGHDSREPVLGVRGFQGREQGREVLRRRFFAALGLDDLRHSRQNGLKCS